MKSIKKFIFTITIGLFLGLFINVNGCAAPSVHKNIYKKTENQFFSLKERQIYLQKYSYWHVKGRIGFTDGKHGNNAQLNWQQANQYFNITLSGALQLSSITIHGTPNNKVILIASDGTKIQTDNANALIYDHTNLNLPITSLIYWIRGLPSPNSEPIYISTDKFNQLKNLKQDGWLIEYQQYRSTDYFINLPAKINLSQGNIKIKLVLQKWQLTAT